jgi:hypothetical protein
MKSIKAVFLGVVPRDVPQKLVTGEGVSLFILFIISEMIIDESSR